MEVMLGAKAGQRDPAQTRLLQSRLLDNFQAGAARESDARYEQVEPGLL